MFFGKEEDIVSLGKGAVLLMEDEDITRELTKEMINYLGYTVEVVTRGGRSYRALQTQ